MSRCRGSTTALKAAQVVAARGHAKELIFLHLGIYEASLNSAVPTVFQAGTFETCYQISFNPNSICRDVVDVLIAPAVPETPEGVKAMRFEVLKLARLSRLKISARN